MSGPWSPQQVEWLQALGIEVLHLSVGAAPATAAGAVAGAGNIPAGLSRAARGVDLAPLLAALGMPGDAASRRVFWRALRPLRKAASGR